MLFLGHMGIGNWLAKPMSKGLPWGWLLFGTCLPDLVDKPLYYIRCWTSGLHGAELGLISGTRTFGHTAVVLLVFAIVGLAGNRRSAAVALGVCTHLLLDLVSDALDFPHRESGALKALLFPFWSSDFAVMPFTNLADHLAHSYGRIALVAGEILGALLLWREARHRKGLVRRAGRL